VDAAYERAILQLEDRHWWYRGRRRILREILESLPLPTPANVLDAGCGSGRNLEELAGFGTVTGLDLAESSLTVARGRGLGEIVAGSVESIPFAADSFDLVLTLDVLEHVDDEAALTELRRVVRPEGFLLATVPAYQVLFGPHDVQNRHRRRYTRASLVRAAVSTGWVPVRLTYFNTLLLPLTAPYRVAQRLMPRLSPKSSNFAATPGWLDRALEQPLRAEAALLRRGVRLPAGLSLLGVFSPT
jgi:SAM-dependent methyltransferase